MPLLLERVWRARGWLLALGLALMAALPTRLWENGPVLCLFKRFLGVECFGCGLTRSVSSLLHGEFSAAAHYNRLGFVVVPFAVLLVVSAPLAARPARRRGGGTSLGGS